MEKAFDPLQCSCPVILSSYRRYLTGCSSRHHHMTIIPMDRNAKDIPVDKKQLAWPEYPSAVGAGCNYFAILKSLIRHKSLLSKINNLRANLSTYNCNKYSGLDFKWLKRVPLLETKHSWRSVPPTSFIGTGISQASITLHELSIQLYANSLKTRWMPANYIKSPQKSSYDSRQRMRGQSINCELWITGVVYHLNTSLQRLAKYCLDQNIN